MQQRNMRPEKTPSKFLGDPSKRFQSTGFTTSMQQRNKYPTIHYSILRLDTDIQILAQINPHYTLSKKKILK